MGKYINKTSSRVHIGPSFLDKCQALVEDGATPIDIPPRLIPNLVCVVDNVAFAAAIYIHNEEEYQRVIRHFDTRNKQWFIWDGVEDFAI